MAAPLNNMATIYLRFGNTQKSLELNFKTLNILERTQDKNAMAFSLNNIANVYSKLQNFEKAREYLWKSYRIRLGLGNKNQIAQSLNNIGGVFLNEFKPDSALFYFSKSLAIAIEKNSIHQMGLCYNNMSICYRDKKDFDKALEFAEKGLKYRQQENDIEGICHSYQNLGQVYFITGDNRNARRYFEEGFRLSKENDLPELILNFSKCLYDLNLKEGRTKEALDNYVLFSTMKDSLNNKELQKLSFQKQFQYEYNKKAFADSIKINEEKLLEQTRHQQVVQRQRFYIIGGIAGFALMGVIAVISLLAFRQKKKSNILINRQKQEVEHQKNIIEEKQKEIIDSINYAKRIQSALLANKQMIAENVPGHFIFFRPKDIVSGDFYWATEHDNKFFIACCDSTGHGVPGAFMSLLNIGFLSEAIKEKDITEPNKVFDYVRNRLIAGISKEGQKDGFDGILVCIDKLTRTVSYAAANNAPFLVSNGKGASLSRDKMPVGKGEKTDPFTLHSVNMIPGDTLYLVTDGYADQFGGPKGKKFMSKKLDELLLSISDQPMEEQSRLLESTFRSWVGELEQVDDVLVLGIKL
jgi:serine phosphatase RsbU (regulator of sigma subunit)